MNNDFSFDKSNLREVILKYPNQTHLGQGFAKDIEVPKRDYTELIICGMGGSAVPASVLVDFLINEEGQSFSLPIYISRGYSLPRAASKNSLVFISSYSGGTEEPIACFEEALKKEAVIVAFSAGGKVEEMAKEKEVPHVKYEITEYANFQPRYATNYAFAAMHQVLTNAGLCAKVDQFPTFSPEKLEEKGKELAGKIKGKTPIFYASDRYKSLAKFLKIKVNENTKTPAFWNYYPELNHNEMVGFTLPQADFFVLMMKDGSEHPQVAKRFDATSALYQRKGIETEIFELEGKTYFERLVNGCILGDWISYYLAKEYDQDPTPVDMVEDLKKRLA